ncbi:MAG: hypothetical protein U9N45_00375 [Gemmatimonadota bacterium]|nr:hypothetical protein [Gemmatimonadota bacterium]
MSEALVRLEQKIKQLLERMDNLEAGNRAFRELAESGGEQMTQQQVIRKIEGLKLEKKKLEKKIESIGRRVDSALEVLEKLEL